MTLTLGSGPFGRNSAVLRNFEVDGPAHVLLWEPYPCRLRVAFGGEIVADSTQAKLLHETGLLPVAYLPEADVRADLLTATDHHTHCPFKGDAKYRTLTVGERVAANAAWTYPRPVEGCPPIAGHLAFYAERMDRWLVEDEEVIGHLRDPYHRVDARRSSRHVRVRYQGSVIAETRMPRVVFETGLPLRFYVPRRDVKISLELSARRTACAYKGWASYWSARIGGQRVENLAWSYEQPLDGAQGLEGHVCFDPSRVEIEA